jgi:hypothetical protein
VQAQPKGRFTYYRLADQRIATILETADSLLADLAKNLYECTRGPDTERVVGKAAKKRSKVS